MIATIGLFSMVYYWHEFFIGPVLSTRQAYYPLQTYIQQMQVVIDTSNKTPERPDMLNVMSNQTLNAAKIFVAVIPILIIYPLLQRQFNSGFPLGPAKEKTFPHSKAGRPHRPRPPSRRGRR